MVTIYKNETPGTGLKLKIGPFSAQNKILIALFLLLILFAGIFFLNKKFGIFKWQKSGEEAKGTIVPQVIYNLAGLVQKIEKNSFILEASIPQVDQAGKVTQKKETRKINITANTKFSRLTFVAQPGSTAKSPVETPIAFSDIKIGDFIEVIASQDISKASDFEASQVRDLPKR